MNSNLRSMLLAAMFASLTAVLGFVTIPLPFSPVPITAQTLAVMLSGGLLGAKWGIVSQLVYLTLGLVGLPVFAGGGSGLTYLLGPTGGFLFGFVIGAYITGRISYSSQERIQRTLAGLFVGGILTPYVLGSAYLMMLTDISFHQAATLAILPFLPGDIFKLIAATVIIRFLRRNHVYQQLHQNICR